MIKIIVKNWMTNYNTFMDKDSFLMKNNSSPMPLCIMYGEILQETEKMYKMDLHGDLIDKLNVTCMKCGRQLKNKVSQYFGIGPECGNHNYTNPFDSEEELNAAVDEMKQKLNNIKWIGWIPKSAIIELNDLDGNNVQAESIKKEDIKITINIKESDKCNGDYSLFISFPYDQHIVNVMREQTIRYWHPDSKEWEMPYKNLNKLKDTLKDYDLDIKSTNEINAEQVLNNNQCNYIPKDFKFKTKPFNHQIEGIEYGLKYDRFLLGDEQGLGKTKQIIDLAVIKKQQKGYKHCLIICGVNGLKWNWRDEVSKHSNEKAYILGTRYDKNGKEKIGSMNDRLQDLEIMCVNIKPNDIFDGDFPYFIITNIETLRNEKIIEKLKKLCDNSYINMIALDEGHKCKDPTSQQGKALLKLQAETMVSMTGTPLMNNPLDLYIHLKWLGYEKHAFYSFKKHYCIYGGYGGYQIVGFRHLDQLKEQFEDVMLRRLKKDVLDLPDKIYTTEYVEMGSKQAKIYKEVNAEIKDNIDKVTSAINPLAELIRLRQATGYTGILSSTIQESAKFDRVEELLDEIVANGEKAIIFSNWTAVTNPAYERFKKYNPAIITGETKDRVAEQNKFMNDDSCKVIIGTIGAMGTGLTLTAANTVIFLDEPWNRATREQAEDRAHRIGTKSNVNIIFMICKDTIDERIHDIVEKKGQMADMLVDGKVSGHNKGLLVQYLLS